MNIPVNKYQTPLTEELLGSLNDEVREQLLDFINNVEFIKNLISPDRKYARDLPRDEKGRIIVDLCNPHILEDMEYFRPTGNCFKKYGVVTHLKPNGNPRSEFGRWFGEEIRRCWEGYVRESDGEWVTGFEYFYLNYEPIIQIKQIGKKKQASRIVDFPKVWEGVHLVFHYLEQARHGGMYDDFEGGKHAVEIARRGASKSYIVAGILACIFLVGENADACRETRGIVTAYDREKLIKDGTLNKFSTILDFCAEHTQFPYQRLQDSLDKMTWKLGYKDLNTNAEMGLKNITLGVTAKDNVEKSRGKRSNFFGYEEFGAFKKFIDIWRVNLPSVQEGDIAFGLAFAIGTGGSEGCLTENNYVFTSNGDLKLIKDLTIKDGIIGYDIKSQQYSIENIEWLNTPTYKECVRITTNSGRILECSTDHPVYSSTYRSKTDDTRVWKWNNAESLNIGDCVAIAQEVPVFGDSTIFDPRLVGMLVGDGSYITSPKVSSCDKEIQDYIKSRYSYRIYNKPYLTKDGKTFEEVGIKGIRDELRKLGIYGQSNNSKRVPEELFRSTRETIADFLAGLIDTDGSINIYKGPKRTGITVNISTGNKILAGQIQMLYLKLGIYSNILVHQPSKNLNKRIQDKNCYYAIEVSSRDGIIKLHESIHLLLSYKQRRLDEAYEIALDKKRWRKTKFESETIKEVVRIGMQKVYNLSASNTHTYLGNGIITHNSDFSGALEIIYNPLGYNVYALPNVFDKINSAKQKTVFFFGAYMNLAGHYNEDGVSDVTGSLVQILNERHKIKYNSSDPMSLTRAKAENPITIQEAIMKRDSTMYPVADLTDRLNSLDADSHAYDDVYVGDLGMNNDYPFPKTGPDYEPVRTFPHKNNRLVGAIEFYKMPERDSKGDIISGRYIAGIDPYDDDQSDTLSLGSIIVLDTFTDCVVCEYTGRPDFADDFYEKCRRILLFYNARANYENNKKGLFKYFSQTNSLYLLADTLDFLKERDDSTKNLNNKSKGSQSTEPVKRYARRCIKDWLNKTTTIPNEDPEKEDITIKQLTKMKGRALILELISWNADGNFDRHDALGMCMLYREEILRLSGGDPEGSSSASDPSDKANDDFFNRNYKKALERKGKLG